MACGIPTIGCYDNGIAEIITDGVNGFLVNGKNYCEIYNKLLMIEDNAYSEVSKNARKTVEKHYTWLESARKLYDIYKYVAREY